ncbi:8-oxo-dGTP diphosphatase [Parabacteroides sp. PF5-5]|uniref:NUDIX hydrolase n=1 Tax=unclassified Parabacteroides TaxID=2649774 RepID=UPI0024763A34|nr:MULTISPECIES: NUDIX domain-containing protein [unclassified Parabacteroides]MDH6305145.1 8-oxo-dGTP diphosphatase [Parabacteroides sp. PH5-39]MDH6316495.1 8-oxo-dGTP diphosphatase [Parabacteroides sp. PF5-13]MDH6320005.1 8-oxo-dGTP diphosphatase [Parabacteroides sp. PH5-13]MDH6323762.1 8-oxo-dGTP diphosphatase [Parabacteroides sp. PH5-8]MDH6327682.1 8-oxo-dGTP diphosphatase [Parabacteroides sp. PH5-41]
MNTMFIHTYVSVDCVVFGFENDQLTILLVRRGEADSHEKELKLPGSLIYNEEDVDDAAHRVLFELTGIKRVSLKQFRCFASPDRANNPEDMKWLDKAYQPNINRLITVAYLSLCKVDRKLNNISKYKQTDWCPISRIPKLPFDHNRIVNESLTEIRTWIENNPSIVFEMLPKKFTISQLHKLYEAIYNKRIDIRNFHKKVAAMPYVIALDEKQKDVSHRAARYYKFDKKVYKKMKSNI